MKKKITAVVIAGAALAFAFAPSSASAMKRPAIHANHGK